MSCRSNAVNSATTSYARSTSGLGDMQTLSLFHQLVREGRDAPEPSALEVAEFQQSFRQRVQLDQSLSESQRSRILSRLANTEYTPDGPTFHAWQNLAPSATATASELNRLQGDLARGLGITSEELAGQLATLERELQSGGRNNRSSVDQTQTLERMRQRLGYNNGVSLQARLPQDYTTLAAYSRMMDAAEATRNTVANNVLRQPLPDSSVIAAAGYNPASQQLEIEFQNGRIYRYDGVDQAVYQELIQNRSAGRYYNREVRGRYSVSLVDDRPQQINPPAPNFNNSTPPVSSGVNEVAESGVAASNNSSSSGSNAEVSSTRGESESSSTGERERARERTMAALRAIWPNQAQIAQAEAAVAEVLTQERAASEAAQERAETTSRQEQAEAAARTVPRYSENMAAFQAVYDAAKARKARGERPVSFDTSGNATGGLGARGTGRGFGVEIEFDLDGAVNRDAAIRAIGLELQAEGLTADSRQHNYHSNGGDYSRWNFERDSTVSGEIISPIMYDEPESWEQLQKVCEIVARNGGKATARTGGHVHVGCGNYDHTPKNHNNLLKLFKKNEDVLYRLAQNPARASHRGTHWCSPNNIPAQDYNSVSHVRSNNGTHGLALNFQSVGGQANDHVEYRMWDGSIEPGIIQSQIKLSLAMTEAAFRAEQGAFDTTTTNTPEPHGSHKRQNQARAAAQGRRSVRATGEAWQAETKSFREMVDHLFTRQEDKEQITSLFAVNKWQGN